jgi:uncharacterized oligopeptide transporter (OPT) family protein
MGGVLTGAPVLVVVVALALSLVLGLVCTRAAGQTDIAPIGPMGQTSLIIFALAGASGSEQLLWLGSIVTVVGSQVTVSLWCLKAGAVVQVARAPQRTAQLVGALAGALSGVLLLALLLAAYPVGSAALPAPGAVMFRTLADALVRERSAVPPWALEASLVAFVFGLLLARMPRKPWVPSPLALGTAFVVPVAFAATVALGSVLAALARRRASEETVTSVATGGVAGESMLGVVIAGLRVAGVLK